MKLIHGDCLNKLKELQSNSIDALITDPPAGISFMNKHWDDDKGGRDEWIEWISSIFKECNRVLKPGAHGLVWAIPRTSHWTAMALENAGFEVRDIITHLFGSGFPKSLDVSKAIDKMYGAEREVVGINPNSRITQKSPGQYVTKSYNPITKASTQDAKQWQGWGTALKPASEHWILVRKKLEEKTVAKNVLKYGTGALNIDESRVGTELIHTNFYKGEDCLGAAKGNPVKKQTEYTYKSGRFPANLVFSCECEGQEHGQLCAVHLLDEQSGDCKTGGRKIKTDCGNALFKRNVNTILPKDNGAGASRFFYCAKVSPSERNAGLEGMPEKESYYMQTSSGKPSMKDGHTGKATARANHHPTVKPQKLMQYLIKLITPPNGIVLDPFMGSGSTGLACKNLNFDFIGIEKEQEYFEIAEKRIANVLG